MLKRAKGSGAASRGSVTQRRKERAATSRGQNRAFSFLEINQRDERPRVVGLTEIRGHHYSPLGRRGLEDILETLGAYVDSLTFAGGSFALMRQEALVGLIETAHAFQVGVSTGGFIEHVLTKGRRQVEKYID